MSKKPELVSLLTGKLYANALVLEHVNEVGWTAEGLLCLEEGHGFAGRIEAEGHPHHAQGHLHNEDGNYLGQCYVLNKLLHSLNHPLAWPSNRGTIKPRQS